MVSDKATPNPITNPMVVYLLPTHDDMGRVPTDKDTTTGGVGIPIFYDWEEEAE